MLETLTKVAKFVIPGVIITLLATLYFPNIFLVTFNLQILIGVLLFAESLILYSSGDKIWGVVFFALLIIFVILSFGYHITPPSITR